MSDQVILILWQTSYLAYNPKCVLAQDN